MRFAEAEQTTGYAGGLTEKNNIKNPYLHSVGLRGSVYGT
jgi:hypothetical protein